MLNLSNKKICSIKDINKNRGEDTFVFTKINFIEDT